MNIIKTKIRARDFIIGYFGEHYQVKAEDIVKASEEEKIPIGTLRRVKSKLGIVSVQHYRCWYWVIKNLSTYNKAREEFYRDNSIATTGDNNG